MFSRGLDGTFVHQYDGSSAREEIEGTHLGISKSKRRALCAYVRYALVEIY